MMPSPSVAQLLADLGELRIDVQAHGNALRFRPPSAITPALMERMRAHKADLLRLLNTETAIAELRQSVDRHWSDPAWRSAWEWRFAAARYANFASLRRVLDDAILQAEVHHRNRHWSAFVSTCRYAHRLASGELWDDAGRAMDELRSELTAWTI